MGRGRAPCCAKVGLNKGSWTPEEDMKLMAHIHKHGHGNWRALPKLAGLLRCGKSCRLRWINYLRPDIKRGNFTEEEEETIIKLHELLGNKWSKIASFLPGRTDNEIKNVWNTHLKKRLAAKEQKPAADEVAPLCSSSSSFDCENSSAQVAVTPVEPNVDAWSNILDDASNSASSSSSTEPCEMNHDSDEEARRGGAHGSMSQEEAEEDALVIPEVVFDQDIWSMIEDDDASSFAPGMETTEGLHQSNRLRLEQKHNGQNNDSEWLKYLEEENNDSEWLKYLEEELGLRGAAMDDPEKLLLTRVEEEGDPVSSYFQKGPSSPFHLIALM